MLNKIIKTFKEIDVFFSNICIKLKNKNKKFNEKENVRKIKFIMDWLYERIFLPIIVVCMGIFIILLIFCIFSQPLNT